MKIEINSYAYHMDIYNGTERMKIIGIRENQVELEGDFSGGTHHTIGKAWFPINGLMDVIKDNTKAKPKTLKLIKTGKEYLLRGGDGETLAITSGTMIGKMLSKDNCREIEFGYDLDELAEECQKSLLADKWTESPSQKIAFIWGFEKCLGILGDRGFTREQMFDAIMMGVAFEERGIEGVETYNELLDFVIKRNSKTEWDVEILYHDIYKDELATLDWFTNYTYGDHSMIGKEFYTEDLGMCKITGIEHRESGGTWLKTNKGPVEWNYQNNKTIFIGEDRVEPKEDMYGNLILKMV